MMARRVVQVFGCDFEGMPSQYLFVSGAMLKKIVDFTKNYVLLVLLAASGVECEDTSRSNLTH
jgi:hypothetical protein